MSVARSRPTPFDLGKRVLLAFVLLGMGSLWVASAFASASDAPVASGTAPSLSPAGTTFLNTCPSPPASGGVVVSFNLSNPSDGSYVVSQGTITVVNVGKNITCTLAPATYDLNALASGGSSFQVWQVNGEVQLLDPSSSAAVVNISTGPVTITAEFNPPASPSPFTEYLLAAILVAVVVVALVVAFVFMRRRSRRGIAAGPASPASPSGPPPTAAPSPTSSPTGAPAWIERWTRYASSAVEGILEEDLWPAVAPTTSPANLLAFTWGRSERLASKYGLAGAHVVRVSRVEGSTGDERIAPTDVDKLVDLVEKHFRAAEGQAVVLPDVHALVNAAGAKNVIRLLEISRDLALERKGSILFTVDPTAVPPSDLALLERGAHKLTPSA